MKKDRILREQRDFSAVYKKGGSKAGRNLVVLYKPNRSGTNRYAFVASKKVGNSVKRNRARRLMKEAHRSLERNIDNGYDIIFVARGAIIEVFEPEVEKDMYRTLKRAGILTNKEK